MFWNKKTLPTESITPKKSASFFIGDKSPKPPVNPFYVNKINSVIDVNNKLTASAEYAQDSDSTQLKQTIQQPEAISQAIANWYASQSFIGHHMCAFLAQNWLINKACSTPARDATRNGYDVISSDGLDVPEQTIALLKKYDVKYRVRWNCEQFVRMGRIFGIRIALFDVQSDDPEYYEKPFNIDGVAKNSYKGITQVDPYWCVPMLVGVELADPANRHFYEPTYWNIGGKKYHRSHLIIFRNGEVPDILKPVYVYGGLPVPQLIMERVYGAERTASESLGLVTSKRTTVWQTNMDMFMADADGNAERLAEWVAMRDNYGIKVGDKADDQFSQFDTALSDLDEVIMTQYQLVAAASNVPATKLLGTTPKGFNSTGEGEAKNYHEELESIQEHDLTELVNRHHQLVMASNGVEVMETTLNWRPVDSPTAKEQAELNKTKADTYQSLVMSGALDGEDVRYRLINDPDSGFHDMGSDNSEVLEDLGLSSEEIQAMQALGVTLDEKAD